MDCPACGYIFDPLEEDQPCPRCVRLGTDVAKPARQPISATLASAPEPAAPAPPRLPALFRVDYTDPVARGLVIVFGIAGAVGSFFLTPVLTAQFTWAAAWHNITWHGRHGRRRNLLTTVTGIACGLMGMFFGGLIAAALGRVREPGT